MDSGTIKAKANALFAEAPFVSRIGNSNDHQLALSLMDELIKDYEANRLLIEVLAASIERWEERAAELADFNVSVAFLDGDEALLRVLVDQYQLKPSDLEPELGARGSVSGLLAGRYKLTCAQIQALSDRFGFNPVVFFRKVKARPVCQRAPFLCKERRCLQAAEEVLCLPCNPSPKQPRKAALADLRCA